MNKVKQTKPLSENRAKEAKYSSSSDAQPTAPAVSI